MTPTPPKNDITIAQIAQLLRQLRESDRTTVLKFTQAILRDRATKRANRRDRFQQPEVDDWRIGS